MIRNCDFFFQLTLSLHIEIVFFWFGVFAFIVFTVVKAFLCILHREGLCIVRDLRVYISGPFNRPNICCWTGHCELFPPECYSSLKHTDTYKVTSVCLFQRVIFLSSTLQSERRSDLRAGVGYAHLSPSMCLCVTITFHHATVWRQNCFQIKGPQEITKKHRGSKQEASAHFGKTKRHTQLQKGLKWTKTSACKRNAVAAGWTQQKLVFNKAVGAVEAQKFNTGNRWSFFEKSSEMYSAFGSEFRFW